MYAPRLLILLFFMLLNFIKPFPSYCDDRGNSYTNPPSTSAISESRYYAPASFAGPPTQNFKNPVSAPINQQIAGKSTFKKPNYSQNSFKYLKPVNYEPIDIQTPKPFISNIPKDNSTNSFRKANINLHQTYNYSASKVNITKPYNPSFSTTKVEYPKKEDRDY